MLWCATIRGVAIGVVLGCAVGVRAQQPELDHALQGSHAAAMVVDVETGKALAQVGDVEAVSLPGSALKPLVLRAALAAGTIREHDALHCPGTLVVKGHNLACTHPRDVTVLDARQALANSCNHYFAELAGRMPSALLVQTLQQYGLRVRGAAVWADDRALMVLGVAGVRVSTREMAVAYRRLALQMARGDAGTSAVRDGLVVSVQTGMAHAAMTQGVVLGGKTGSMHDGSDPLGHGWFAGIVFGGGRPQRVLVVYLPGGNGSDAAAMAHRFLEAERGGGR